MRRLAEGKPYSGTFVIKRRATPDRYGRKRWMLRCAGCGNELLVLEDQLKRDRKTPLKCKIC